MAFRPEIRPLPVLINSDMSKNETSLPTVIPKISMVSYGYSWAGSSPVGALSVQVSNDYSLDATGTVLNAGTWNTIYFYAGGSLVNTLAVSGNTGNAYIDIPQISSYAIRTVYTYTSGTGTLQAILVGKVS